MEKFTAQQHIDSINNTGLNCYGVKSISTTIEPVEPKQQYKVRQADKPAKTVKYITAKDSMEAMKIFTDNVDVWAGLNVKYIRGNKTIFISTYNRLEYTCEKV